jgi:hypothetical protein
MDPKDRTRQSGCWWEDLAERTTLARWLADEGRLDPNDLEAVLDVIEKPRRYTREYTDMCAAVTSERALRLLNEAA